MEYPKELLKDLFWSFGLGEFDSESEFIEELQDYNQAVGDNTLNLNEVVIDVEKIIVLYEAYDEEVDDDVSREVVLESDNGSSFQLGEIMYKLNQNVSEYLEEVDSRFFEGLFFETDQAPEYPGVPVYIMLTGS